MKFLNFGLEAIAFQSPEFANKMTSLMESILAMRSGKVADNSDEAKNLIKLVRDTTGMKVDIIFDTEYAPCTLPFHINPDSILGHTSLKDFYLEDSEATMKRIKAVKGSSYIDLKNAKVSGIFSEINVPIYMGYYTLRGCKLTAKEIVAILAHEIGHNFVAYEMAFRTARTNQVLSAISKAQGGGDKDVYKYVLKTTEEVYDLKTGVLQELVDVKDQQTSLVVVLGQIEADTHNKSITGNTTYDTTTFEAMSDNYAARLGLGRELVSGLEKLYKTMGSAEFSQKTRIILTVIDTITVTQLILATRTLLIGSNPVMASLVIVLTAFSLWMRLDGRDHNNVYDKLTVRFKRIKEQVITYLKDNKLPTKDVKIALQSIENMEKTIAEISEYKGYLPAIFNMLDPASIKVNNAINIQKKLESIAANDLYIKAAQLRTLD